MIKADEVGCGGGGGGGWEEGIGIFYVLYNFTAHLYKNKLPFKIQHKMNFFSILFVNNIYTQQLPVRLLFIYCTVLVQ